MGYTTTFQGKFEFDRQLTDNEQKTLELFHDMRHVKRNLKPFFDNSEIFGTDGELFCVYDGKLYYPGNIKPIPNKEHRNKFKTLKDFYNSVFENSITDNNRCPDLVPGLWCQWCISGEGKFLEWDESEKFYSYDIWLGYLIRKFFEPMNLFITGVVHYNGESFDDHGRIVAYHNMYKKYPDKLNFDIDWETVEDIQKTYAKEKKNYE